MAPWWLVCAALLAAAPLAVQAVVFVANTADRQHAAGGLMRRELVNDDFREVNPPESARTYSSVWGNNVIGTGHARSMLDSPQAWSAAANNQDQWIVLDLQETMAVGGVYFQARNGASCCGNQLVTEAHFEYSLDCFQFTPVGYNQVFRTGVIANNNGKYLVSWTKPKLAKCIKVWPDLWENHLSLRVGVSAGSPTKDDLLAAALSFRAENSGEASRTYSSIWGNNAQGTGHARSKIDSPQGWSAAHNRKDEWVNIDMGKQMTVRGVYFQSRNKASGAGFQIVTEAYFEYSKDCIDYTPIARSNIFKTGVVALSERKSLVSWARAKVAKCVRIGVSSWEHHISLRAAPSAREVAPEDRAYEVREFLASNPAEARRTYSSIWGNNAIGTGHARSMLDSPQAWSAAINNANQWVIIQLEGVRSVKGAYFQGRNQDSCCGNQIVTEVTFATSEDCIDYATLNDGEVYATGIAMNDNIKRFVKWPVEMLAKCVKISVVGWAHHISMRAGLSVGALQSLLSESEIADSASQALLVMNEVKSVNTTATSALIAVVKGVNFDHYGDGTPAHTAEDFASASYQLPYSFYEDGTPAHTAEDFVNTSEVVSFEVYGDGTPTHVA